MTVSMRILCADDLLQLTNVGIAVSCIAPRHLPIDWPVPYGLEFGEARGHLLILFRSLHQLASTLV
jgi:hypothetical protein